MTTLAEAVAQASVSLRYRLSKFIAREVSGYFFCESEWEPMVDVLHTQEEVRIRFTFPAHSGLPNYLVTIKEEPH